MLVLLIGPKGSGKSHIGRVLEAKLGVRFFPVELLWMAHHEECDREGRPRDLGEGVERVAVALRDELRSHARVCVETTGASPEILDGLLALAPAEKRVCVRVEAPLDLCLERIRSRDPSRQIPMDEAAIRRVHELSQAVDVSYDARLENLALEDGEIVALLRPWLGQPAEPIR